MDFLRFACIFTDFHGFSWIFKEFQRFAKMFKDFQRFAQIFADCQGFAWIFLIFNWVVRATFPGFLLTLSFLIRLFELAPSLLHGTAPVRARTHPDVKWNSKCSRPVFIFATPRSQVNMHMLDACASQRWICVYARVAKMIHTHLQTAFSVVERQWQSSRSSCIGPRTLALPPAGASPASASALFRSTAKPKDANQGKRF